MATSASVKGAIAFGHIGNADMISYATFQYGVVKGLDVQGYLRQNPIEVKN